MAVVAVWQIIASEGAFHLSAGVSNSITEFVCIGELYGRHPHWERPIMRPRNTIIPKNHWT
jgi:hypothetical protein